MARRRMDTLLYTHGDRGVRQTRFPAQIAKITTCGRASRLRRSAAARYAACACSTVRGARLDAAGPIPVQSRSPHARVRKRAGAAGTRVGSVEVGFFDVDFSVWLNAPRAAGPAGNVSGFDPSLGRREPLLRRRRCGASERKIAADARRRRGQFHKLQLEPHLSGESSGTRCESLPCSSRAAKATSRIAYGRWRCGRVSGNAGGSAGAPLTGRVAGWVERRACRARPYAPAECARATGAHLHPSPARAEAYSAGRRLRRNK